jgi:hypothetical protein
MEKSAAKKKGSVMEYAIEMAVAREEYLRAAEFAEIISVPAKRADTLNGIARAAIDHGDYASAEELCRLYPDEISPDVGWDIAAFLADFVIEEDGASVPMPFYARKSG